MGSITDWPSGGFRGADDAAANTARLPSPLWGATKISAYAIPIDTMVTAIIVKIASASPAASESAVRWRLRS